MELAQLDLSVYRSANCEDHPVTEITESDIASVICSRQWCYCEIEGREACKSFCDTSGAAIYGLRDGRYAVAFESSDTSGHG